MAAECAVFVDPRVTSLCGSVTVGMVTMSRGNVSREDLVFYILSGLVAAWAILCVADVLMHAK